MLLTISIIYTKKARNIRIQGNKIKNHERLLNPLLHKYDKTHVHKTINTA
jgi:hypothetical protein